MNSDILQFIVCFSAMSRECYKTAVNSGWHEKEVEVGTSIALMHSELSEALEGLRHGNPPDDKIPEFNSTEAELADVVIRIMDFSVVHNLRIAEAIVAKSEFNKTRSYKHGNKKF